MPARSPMRFSTHFVGRIAEMQRLQAATEVAARGQGCVVTVTGDPGIGKSRLLEEFVGEISHRALVLEGRCSYVEGAPPYFPWVQVITGIVRATKPEVLRKVMGGFSSVLAEVVPPVREALGKLQAPVPLEHPGSARFRFFQSVVAILRRVAEKRTLVLVLHDLHWVDPPSAALLGYLLGEIERARLLLVMSYRDRQVVENHPLRPALAELIRLPRHEQIALGGLTPSEVRELLTTALSGKVREGAAELVHSTTGGVPLFVRELAQTLYREGRLARQVQDDSLHACVPTSIKDLIGGWLQQLSPGGRDAVAVAAAIGMDCTVDVLAACCAESPSRLMEVMQEAVTLSLLDPGQPGQFRFSHSVMRESILANLSSSRLARVHAQVAEGLERRYGGEAVAKAAQLAYHFGAAGGLAAHDRYLRYALLAGEQAIRRHAYEDAVELFERALACIGADARTRAQLLFGLGRARVALNQREEAIDLLREAFELFVRVGDANSAVAAAEYPFVVSFRRSGVAELSQKALALSKPDSLQAGRLECQYGLALAQEEREYGEARRACKRALEVARSHGDSQLEARSLLLAAFIEREEQNLKQCLKRSLEALKLSRRIPDLLRITAAHHLAQEALIAKGAFIRGNSHAANGLAAAAQVQDRYWLMLAYAANQRYRIARGDWRGAREFSDRGLALGPNDPFLLANRARLEYETGNPAVGEAYLKRYLQRLKREVEAPADREARQQASVASVVPLICRLVEANDWLDLAEAAARALLDSPRPSAEWRFRAASCLGLIAAVREDATGACECYARITEMLNPDPESTLVFCRASLTFVQAQLARIAHTAGDLDRALTHFEDAQRDCRAARDGPELAWICYDHAGVLLAVRGPGDADRAAALLGEAARLADRYGLPPLRAKIAEMRSSAVRPLSPGGLTSREVDVLVLLAKGKTNKEIAAALFIAERTASNHVSNILAKIKCGNRVEAAAFAHLHGLVKP
jgi:DNA-binding CsgD family transcriptional regulator/DNA replicative helicase MCM subunit Mcm2 (Cdc46/Mcm family)